MEDSILCLDIDQHPGMLSSCSWSCIHVHLYCSVFGVQWKTVLMQSAQLATTNENRGTGTFIGWVRVRKKRMQGIVGMRVESYLKLENWYLPLSPIHTANWDRMGCATANTGTYLDPSDMLPCSPFTHIELPRFQEFLCG